MNEHLKEIRAGYLRKVGAGLATMTVAVLPRDWLWALGLSWSDATVWTIRVIVFAIGVGLLAFQAWTYCRRIRSRIAELEQEVSYLRSGLLIHSASYRAGDSTADVTLYLRREIAQGRRRIPVGDNLLDGGKDPCPCIEKDLIIEFSRMGEKQPKKIHQTTPPNYLDLT
jgi:hypothetical protein